MRSTLGILFAGLVLAGCHGNDTAVRRDQQYDVVEEGSAAGVTGSIGVATATTPPLTSTNTDSTSNFALSTANPDLTPPAPAVPGSVAGTLPEPSAATRPGVPHPRVIEITQPTRPMTSSSTIGSEPIPSAPPPLRRYRPTVDPATAPVPRRQVAPPSDTAETAAPTPDPATETDAPPPPRRVTPSRPAPTDTSTTEEEPPPPPPPPPNR